MSHTPHQLHEEFPEFVEKMHEYKMNNAHFVKLSDNYQDINNEIHRIESGVEPSSDDRLEELKKQRLHLKDEIATLLAA